MTNVNSSASNDPWAALERPAAGDVTPMPLDSARINGALDQLLRTCSDELQATHTWLELARSLTHARGLLLYGADETRQLSSQPVAQSPTPFSDLIVGQLFGFAMHGLSHGAVQVAQANGSTEHYAIAVPIHREDERPEVLVCITTLSTPDTRVLAGLAQVLQLLAAHAALWRGRWHRRRSGTDEAWARSWLEVLPHAAQQPNYADAVFQWCRLLNLQLATRMVAIGTRRANGTCQLVAVAPAYPFEKSSPAIGWLEGVMTESLLYSVDDVTTETSSETQAMRSLKNLWGACEIQCETLWDQNQHPAGVCLIVSDARLDDETLARWRTLCPMIGTQLGLLRDARRLSLRFAYQKWRHLTNRQRGTLIALGLATLVGLLMVPVPASVTCKAELQPMSRHFVAAPYEGRLETALVEPGDLVVQGQVLARMDGREIRLELASLDAELEGATKERDRALVLRDAASAQIALLEIQRLQLKHEMLQQRLDHLAIRSPAEGMVISGDPKKLEGARLGQGQSLLEVGPLDQMVMEVLIPDAEIDRAQVGRDVTCRLESLPHQPLRGRLVRIYPRSELREAENVFVGRVELKSQSPELRPGMRGRAKLSVGARPLIWILFHRAWDHLIFRWGW